MAVAGDVECRIVNASTTDIDTQMTAMRVTTGVSGSFLIANIYPQVVLVSIVGL